jgi:ribosomal protein L11 methyltransferase
VSTWALHTALSLEQVDVHAVALDAAGLLGVVEVDGRATVYLPHRVDGLPLAGEWELVPERDWNEAWKAGLEAVTVGAVTVVPPWLAPPPDTPIVLVVEPAQAFGTGHHETTTACLGALQELDLRGRSVLDVGTGTGVLALAAARLGAGRVVAVDVDPLAVTAARDNAARNGVTGVDVRPGSVEAVGAERFDVVVANLDTATISALAGGLAERLAPRGTFVASGVSRERAGEALAALDRAGLAISPRPGREWVLLVGGHRPGTL